MAAATGGSGMQGCVVKGYKGLGDGGGGGGGGGGSSEETIGGWIGQVDTRTSCTTGRIGR